MKYSYIFSHDNYNKNHPNCSINFRNEKNDGKNDSTSLKILYYERQILLHHIEHAILHYKIRPMKHFEFVLTATKNTENP